MRKLTSLMYFFIASALFLTSCGGDDEEEKPAVQTPTLTFVAGSTVTDGATLELPASTVLGFTITGKKADKNLSTLAFYEGNDAIVNVSNLTIEGEKPSKNPYDIKSSDNGLFQYTVTLKLADAGTTNYKIVLTDKDGVSTSVSFTVVIKGATTDLGTAKSFTLKYVGSSQTDGANINEEALIKYNGNTSGSEGKFEGSNSSVKFVDITSNTSTTTTIEDLITLYNAGTKVSNFTVKADAKFESKTVIAYDGTNYVWVKFTDLKLAASNNVATGTFVTKAMN